MLDNQFNEFTVCIMDSYDMLIRLYASVNFPVYTTPSKSPKWDVQTQ